MKKLIFVRRSSRIFFFTLFIYVLWSASHTALLFKIDPLVSIAISISNRVIVPGIIFSAAMLILTFVFGRFFCGWACPMGSIIDCMGIRAKNKPLNLSWIKYYVFGLIIALAFLGIQIAWVFDPLAIMARAVTLNFIPFFILFLIICASFFITKKFWCRALCPLGAMYAIIAKLSKKRLPRPPMRTRNDISDKNAISRKDFLFLIASSFLLLGFKGRGGALGAGKKLVRPPGVSNEREFLNKCVRCGNCIRICPTNGLQPVIFESGLGGIWTPHLVPEIGYCEYNCTLCGTVCPTAAIPKLSLADKKEKKLGMAEINKDICIPWSLNKECNVCEEHCPVPQKAIKVYGEIKKPYVDSSLCVGCGICQNKCPTRPYRAITVLP